MEINKTMAFNIVALIVAVLGAYGYSGELPEGWMAFVVPIVALINLILKYWSRTASGKARNV